MKRTLKGLLAGAALAVPFAAAHAGDGAARGKITWDKIDTGAWHAPRTAWGDPDLRGQWPIDYLAQTPRERPPQYANQAELTDAQYAAALKNAEQQLQQYEREEKGGQLGMGHWTERGKPLRQTSLITEPNGHVPPATEEGKRLSQFQKSSWSEKVWNWAEDFSPYDRCISRGMPGSMLPGAYNSGIAIYQSPGYVVIKLEMIHEDRIIPLDGRGAPAAPVKNWLGYSRGHWEGNALVIETTNFVPNQPITSVAGNARPIPNSDRMKVIERLTPTGPDTIQYEAWIDDPVTLTAPFKLDFPWRRNSGYVQYEYACHEGNEQFRAYIEGTSTNPRLAARRDAKWKELHQQAVAQGDPNADKLKGEGGFLNTSGPPRRN